MKYVRCDHGFYLGCCPDEDCKHFDGKGEGAGPESTLYAWCITCKNAVLRSEAVPTARKSEWKCKHCAFCIECKQIPRPRDSRYCKTCFDMLTAPKPCQCCPELIYCNKPLKKNLASHRKRNKHHKCAIRYARNTIIKAMYLPAAE